MIYLSLSIFHFSFFISYEAGHQLEEECNKIIEKIGKMSVTEVVVTTAGRLPYNGVIHAVGPRMGDGKEQSKIEKTLINCLQLADNQGWKSLAFPAISTGIFYVPKDISAKAFNKAILYYWYHFSQSTVNSIWLSLLVDDYPVFEKILNQGDTKKDDTKKEYTDKERDIHVYELNKEDMELEDDSDISQWIKRTSGGWSRAMIAKPTKKNY